MSKYVAYDAVNTKIKSKISRLLDDEGWKNLLECTNIEQIVSTLKESPEFEMILKNADPHEIRRDDLETVFGRLRVAELESIIHYFSGPYKAFLQTLLFEFELSDLILLIRKIAQNESLENIKEHFVHSEKFSVLAFDKLMSSSNISDLSADLASSMKGSSYYEKFKNLSNEDIIRREFHIEMKLQMYLYSKLLKKAKDLNAEDRAEVEDILGFKLDYENIQWIYRGKKYYNISPEEILIYCLPGGKKITYQRLKKLCYAKTVEEIKFLAHKYLKKNDVFNTSEDSEIGINMDRNFLRYLCKKDINRKTIGSVLSYYYMGGIIFKDLVTITEGIKYEVPTEILNKYLIQFK